MNEKKLMFRMLRDDANINKHKHTELQTIVNL